MKTKLIEENKGRDYEYFTLEVESEKLSKLEVVNIWNGTPAYKQYDNPKKLIIKLRRLK